MRSLLSALEAGRLVELPTCDKETSLRYLAHLIEAIPEFAPGIDLAGEILKREGVCNSGRSLGVACPHARVPGHGDLVCALGWSPAGIDYGAQDGEKVHLVVMYFIPDVQKNEYLKELSVLAGAVTREGNVQSIARAEDIASVRGRLLQWAEGLSEADRGEDPSEGAAAPGEDPEGSPETAAEGLPLLIVAHPEGPRVVVCRNRELAEVLEKDPLLDPILRKRLSFERLGYRFTHRGTRSYDPARPVYDLVAVRIC